MKAKEIKIKTLKEIKKQLEQDKIFQEYYYFVEPKKIKKKEKKYEDNRFIK